MALPEERRENLKKAVADMCDQDLLNEVDALTIIQICLDACEREKSDILEQGLRMRIMDGGDHVC